VRSVRRKERILLGGIGVVFIRQAYHIRLTMSRVHLHFCFTESRTLRHPLVPAAF
jgi:hypothetical protein